MKHFHPAFSRPLRTHSRPRHWNLLENLFDQEQKSSSSSVQEGKFEVSADKSNEENKTVEPATKMTSKQFMSRVSCQEDMEKVEIKIQLHGHKFKAENLDVQVINNDVLVVKAEDDEEKFERKFKLPSNVLFDKIESKFDVKEENVQSLSIHVPKDIKRIQVPIS